MTRTLLLFEALVLFVLLPLAVRLLPLRLPPLPLLWAAALYCLFILRRDPSFPVTRLWNPHALKGQLLSIALLFTVIAILIAIGVQWFTPTLLFGLPRTHPAHWAIVMVLYPVLSVYPQSLIYRAFFLHRYANLLTHPQMAGTTQRLLLILLSSTAFSFMHIIFRNPLAVVLTFGGGLLFAWRYLVTESLAASSFEHALYGCFLFTVGLGQYFYHGRVRLS